MAARCRNVQCGVLNNTVFCDKFISAELLVIVSTSNSEKRARYNWSTGWKRVQCKIQLPMGKIQEGKIQLPMGKIQLVNWLETSAV